MEPVYPADDKEPSVGPADVPEDIDFQEDWHSA